MQRIIIIGSGCSGKSTFSRQLGDKLLLPVRHLDKHFWLANWTSKGEVTWQKELDKLIGEDRWIIDGDYKESYAKRAERADTIIFLDVPRYKTMARFIKRVIKNRGKTRADMAEGNIEKINYAYLKWLYKYDRKIPLNLVNMQKNTKNTYILSNKSQVKEFLNNL